MVWRKLAEMLLARLLLAIEKSDKDYAARYDLVLNAVSVARKLGYKAGLDIDSCIALDLGVPIVAFIVLPTGRVGWHMPVMDGEYDGHTTKEKYERCREYARRLGVAE